MFNSSEYLSWWLMSVKFDPKDIKNDKRDNGAMASIWLGNEGLQITQTAVRDNRPYVFYIKPNWLKIGELSVDVFRWQSIVPRQ